MDFLTIKKQMEYIECTYEKVKVYFSKEKSFLHFCFNQALAQDPKVWTRRKLISNFVTFLEYTVFLNRYQAGIIEPVDLSTEYFIG